MPNAGGDIPPSVAADASQYAAVAETDVDVPARAVFPRAKSLALPFLAARPSPVSGGGHRAPLSAEADTNGHHGSVAGTASAACLAPPQDYAEPCREDFLTTSSSGGMNALEIASRVSYQDTPVNGTTSMLIGSSSSSSGSLQPDEEDRETQSLYNTWGSQSAPAGGRRQDSQSTAREPAEQASTTRTRGVLVETTNCYNRISPYAATLTAVAQQQTPPRSPRLNTNSMSMNSSCSDLSSTVLNDKQMGFYSPPRRRRVPAEGTPLGFAYVPACSRGPAPMVLADTTRTGRSSGSTKEVVLAPSGSATQSVKTNPGTTTVSSSAAAPPTSVLSAAGPPPPPQSLILSATSRTSSSSSDDRSIRSKSVTFAPVSQSGSLEDPAASPDHMHQDAAFGQEVSSADAGARGQLPVCNDAGRRTEFYR